MQLSTYGAQTTNAIFAFQKCLQEQPMGEVGYIHSHYENPDYSNFLSA